MGSTFSYLKSDSLECLMSSPDTVHLTGNYTSYFTDPICSAVDSADGGGEVVKCCRATLLNCRLQSVCKGKLVLRTHELLFVDRSTSFTWPLCSLRWYGENANFFVFESGRRCPSGSGLFLFRCKRSNKLSACLQEQINSILRIKSSDSTNPCITKFCIPNISKSFLHQSTPTDLILLTDHPDDGESGIKYGVDGSTKAYCFNELGPCIHSSGSESSVEEDDSATTVDAVRDHTLLSAVSNYSRLSCHSLNPVTSGTTSSSGQYLIPAAPHAYVNQPHRVSVDLLDSGFDHTNYIQNDYVVGPISYNLLNA